MDGTNIMGQSYAMSIQGAEHLIDKACVLADAADRAESVYVKALFGHYSNVLYARAVSIKSAAREEIAERRN